MADMKIVVFALATAGYLTSGAAQAALHDRGNGLLYDDVLNVTWLQDANYAKTSGYDADGKMNWNAAKSWAEILTFAGYDDWRLPTTSPVGINWNYSTSKNGTTDNGYNITSPQSELSYMYHVNLGLKSYYNTSGSYQPDFGVFGDGTAGFQKDVGLVKSLQSSVYWSGTAYAPEPARSAWVLNTGYGYQGEQGQDGEFYTWAVRSGDVVSAPIPEPETYAMMLAGLGLLGVAARRRKQKSDT